MSKPGKYPIHPTPKGAVNDATLRKTAGKLGLFVVGATLPNTYAVLASAGFNERWLEQGRAMFEEYKDLCKQSMTESIVQENSRSNALSELREFSQGIMQASKLVLELSQPQLAIEMFAGLDSTRGSNLAVHDAKDFLQRLKVLRKRCEGSGVIAADAQGLALLESAGITASVVANISEMIKIAEKVPEVRVEDAALSEEEDLLLRTIHAWLTTWTRIVRLLTTRRDIWLSLGIGKRKPGKSEEDDIFDEPVLETDSTSDEAPLAEERPVS